MFIKQDKTTFRRMRNNQKRKGLVANSNFYGNVEIGIDSKPSSQTASSNDSHLLHLEIPTTSEKTLLSVSMPPRHLILLPNGREHQIT